MERYLAEAGAGIALAGKMILSFIVDNQSPDYSRNPSAEGEEKDDEH